jgi:GT2 family glycosyltransferase
VSFDVSTILVNFNTEGLLPEALDALGQASAKLKNQILVVDNASKDDSVALLRREYPDCELVVNTENVGFGRANNQALGAIKGRYVLLLNTDAFVSADTVEKTIAYMDSHPECGILGVRLVGRDGVLQPSARYFPTPWNLFLHRTGLSRYFSGARLVDDMNWDHASVRKCDWVPGCYYLVRREVIDEVGLFDPRYFLYYEEVDHCFSAKKAGWEVHYFPYTSVVHIGGESAKTEGEITQRGRQLGAIQIESELLYFRKHYGVWAAWRNVLLQTLADLILIMKRILTNKHPIGLQACRQHVMLLWSVFLRTRWASRPTR